MTTAVSACFVRPGRVGGAEYALYNLLDGLRQLPPAGEPWTIVTARPLRAGFEVAPLVVRPVPAAWLRNRIAIETVALPVVRGVDRWLLPNYYTPPGLRGRVVTMIHDAQYAHYPENFSMGKRRWLAAAHHHTLRRADIVIAISDFVAADLLRLYGSQFAEKIRVIPNAVSFTRLEGGELPFGVPADREIVLCVAANYRHKNVATLVRAFAKIVRRRSDAHLVLVGQRPDLLVGARHAVDIRPLITELELTDRVTVAGHVSDGELGALYRAAAVLAMPSLFEGFGLPVVEALGMGVPVVTTRSGSLVEVSLGLANYLVDPLDPLEMAAALTGVLGGGQCARPTPDDANRVRACYAPVAMAALVRSAVDD